ncbi:TRAP transporter large permease subunit [Curvibacter sp. PAE-UM]|uniref:TRAP transporter large permease n=1 Tax=Curvibacter sp. PAE-UM TaxID=1714344 RepID=UPI00070D2987|nr:TRAP transporter large permease subunit [Curvibacter sp. PAE-UM]KRI01123.1 C4-dicarboxylate ABC transporter [Curvibacter sp. PAE-UM]
MKIRKELWFGFTLMGLIILAALTMLVSVDKITNGHIGLLMLSLVVVAIMLGFPTAFTLMGMGMIFTWVAYEENTTKTLDLMVSAAYKVMSNDVLISIPLFVFMGYLVERANLIEKLFRSLHLALARLPGALAVATLVTCAVFATATGIVGAVVTLMGLLALPQMLRAGYDVKMSAGAITAGGCLGILIPPSVMLIVYGATAGVSVVQLYAGAFFPGLMLAGLYILYVIIVAKFKPHMAPPLTEKERYIPLPPLLEKVAPAHTSLALPALLKALKGQRNADVPTSYLLKQLGVVLMPLILFVFVALWSYASVTTVPPVEEVSSLQVMGAGNADEAADADEGGLAVPPGTEAEEIDKAEAESAPALAEPAEPVAAAAAAPTSQPAPAGFWIGTGVGALALAVYYGLLSFTRFEVFKMLLTSFFPLLVLILAVLGSIVMGLATPTEAAAVGALGGFLLAAAYKKLTLSVVTESVFLTAKTSAMVCWLFVGSAIFSAAFALLGGQELVENWVMSMNLTKTQFLVLSQVIIFILGWPLEWTEIIVIFMPIFIPLLDNFGVDPLFFGLLVALNLQTAFLSPPVAMAAFYLKGVSPPHVTLNQIFAGMLPFMGIQVFAIILLYNFPAIGLWLPQVLYK